MKASTKYKLRNIFEGIMMGTILGIIFVIFVNVLW